MSSADLEAAIARYFNLKPMEGPSAVDFVAQIEEPLVREALMAAISNAGQWRSALYFEAHVTIEPVFERKRLDKLTEIARRHHFRVADLLM